MSHHNNPGATFRSALQSLFLIIACGVACPTLAECPSVCIASLESEKATGEATKHHLSLGDWLAIKLVGDLPIHIEPGSAVLFLNGRKITGLKDTQYRPADKALMFHLTRDSGNAEDWKPLLGSPTMTPRTLAVGLWLQEPKTGSTEATITDSTGLPPTIALELISTSWLTAAVIAVLIVLGIVWAAASNTNILKDGQLPQLAPKDQPFSLGRCQMAFWFSLIFATFVFLFVLLGDYETLTTQSLILMGLSGATAVFAVAIDASKDTPIDATNETLRALGLNSYADIVGLQAQITQRQETLKQTALSDSDAVLRLQTDIADRLNKWRTYRELTRPFVSEGWYRDITTDINGLALHRLQVVVWTVTLGTIFVIECYANLSMPKFSDTLLALMGVTSAGYLGFKYPEHQS